MILFCDIFLSTVCSKQRKSLVKGSSSESLDNVKSSISYLNLIICLVAKYFGQADLADD